MAPLSVAGLAGSPLLATRSATSRMDKRKLLASSGLCVRAGSSALGEECAVDRVTVSWTPTVLLFGTAPLSGTESDRLRVLRKESI
jgi:hypothetical protein